MDCFFIIQAMDFRNGFVVLAYLSTPDNIKVFMLIICIHNRNGFLSFDHGYCIICCIRKWQYVITKICTTHIRAFLNLENQVIRLIAGNRTQTYHLSFGKRMLNHFRGESRTAATPKMEYFVIIVNGFPCIKPNCLRSKCRPGQLPCLMLIGLNLAHKTSEARFVCILCVFCARLVCIFCFSRIGKTMKMLE